MPQSDFLITGGAAPEGSGLNVRLRIQAAFLAAISHSCGATEPTTPYPHMFWVDETNGLLKQRNITNDAWLTKWDITKGQLATLASPTFTGNVNLPTTSYIGGVQIAKTVSPVFSGNAVFESLTAAIGVSLPANTTIGAVSATELSYLDGVTSSIQSQLNALSSSKQENLVSGANIKTVNGNSLVGSGNVVITQNPSAVFSNSQTFTTSGTFTVPADVTKVMVVCAHAGAGGGGGGPGSTRGGYGGNGSASVYGAFRIVPVTGGQNIPVIVALGGNGGVGGTKSGSIYNASSPGGVGGDSSFGNITFLGSKYNGIGGLINLSGVGYDGGAGLVLGGSAPVFACYSQQTSDANNGSNGSAYSGNNGGAGGKGGNAIIVVYW